MPKVILEFNLPEEQKDFNLVNKSSKYYQALWEIKNHIRGSLKHGHKYKTADEALEGVERLLIVTLSEDIL